MDKDLINIEIENMVKQIVDTLENHNPSDMRPDGFLDGRFHDLIQEAITSAIPVSYTHLTLPTTSRV